MGAIESATLARSAGNSADQIAAVELVLDILDPTPIEKARWMRIADDHLWALDELKRLMPDDVLQGSYQRTYGKPDDPDAAALLAQIERRGLGV